MFSKYFALLALSGALSLQAQVTPLRDGWAGSTLNQQASRASAPAAKSGARQIAVFSGDTIIPQFVDGDGWKTTVTLVNLESRAVTARVFFFQDDGTDLLVDVVGLGVVRGVELAFQSAGSLTFETTGTARSLASGWARLDKSTGDTIAGMAIFRQRVDGRPDQEAVVPIVNQFSTQFVLLYDNTAFTTAVALANPSGRAVSFPVNIRNEEGAIVDRQTLSLPAFGHTAFTTPDTWRATAGRRGSIEFNTAGVGIGALGLRFGQSAFTSFHALENVKWVQNP